MALLWWAALKVVNTIDPCIPGKGHKSEYSMLSLHHTSGRMGSQE